MMRDRRAAVTPVLLRLAAGACCAASMLIAATAFADQKPAPAPKQATILAWPEPPAPPRIRFMGVITPATHGGKPSTMSRFWKIITGGNAYTPEIEQPYGVAVDAIGRVFVADTFAQTIHVFNTRENRYSSFHVDGTSLIGVAVSGDLVFVTDSAGARVHCFTSRGKRVWSTAKAAGFLRPTGIASTGNRVYVVDTSAAQVVSLDMQGRVLGRFGSRGGEPGQFNFPTNVALGPDGRVYVTDSMNFRVQSFTADGAFISMFGALGDGAGDFNKPKGIALDSDGHVYVVEGLHDTVQIYDADGRFLLNFGESGTGDGQFWLPTGMAILGDVIYVSDASNRRLQVFKYLKEQK
jgi:DNA-binding beta-propeller fold protein YncE